MSDITELDKVIKTKCIHCGISVLIGNPKPCPGRSLHDYRAPLLVKRSVLDELVQQCWRQWANSNSGMGAPVMLALERAVELAGGEIEEDAG